MRTGPFALAVLTLLSAPYSVADTRSPITFDLHTTDSSPVSGPLLKLQSDWAVSLGGPKLTQIAGAKFISLRRLATPLPPHPLGEHLVLAGGDRVPCHVQELRDERLRVRTGFGQEITVPLTQVGLLWFAAPDGTDEAELFLRRLATQRRTRDVVLLRNGDTVEGTLNGLDGKTMRVELQNKEVSIERGKVAIVALNSELSQPARPRGVYGYVVLKDGGRLSLASAESAGQALTAKTLFGTAVTVPLEQIVALDIRQGSAVYLSDLKPKRYEHTPYLGVRWPMTNDTNVAGRPLRLAGSTHDKGIGLHSESRLTYDLDAGYRWFEAWVGLDERTGRSGSVRLRVLLDGKPVDLGEDRELTGRDAPRPLRVRVAGTSELTLVVEFGERGDVGDHVNFVDARFLK